MVMTVFLVNPSHPFPFNQSVEMAGGCAGDSIQRWHGWCRWAPAGQRNPATFAPPRNDDLIIQHIFESSNLNLLGILKYLHNSFIQMLHFYVSACRNTSDSVDSLVVSFWPRSIRFQGAVEASFRLKRILSEDLKAAKCHEIPGQPRSFYGHWKPIGNIGNPGMKDAFHGKIGENHRSKWRLKNWHVIYQWVFQWGIFGQAMARIARGYTRK